jgi:hypothetical protein
MLLQEPVRYQFLERVSEVYFVVFTVTRMFLARMEALTTDNVMYSVAFTA